jgi:ABC-type antimicrobial peptide transport system permease subunit
MPQFTDPLENEEPTIYQVGDIITLNLSRNGRPVTVEIVGVASASNSAIGGILLPPDLISSNQSDFTLNMVMVAPEKLNEVLLGLSSLPLIITFDISFFDGILQRLITQFSALPLVVGIFSLGAAAVINANTVALSILERRRQIGVLRAVGLKDGRVLRVLILENVIVCLLGGIIGIGLSALGVSIMTTFGLDVAILIPANAMPIVVGLILLSVLIGTLATLASGLVAVRERITSTLRYE